MITSDTLLKIDALFRTLQMLDFPSVQVYDPEQEYRKYCLFAVGLTFGNNCTMVFINFPKEKINAWRLKQWEKRKTKIPHESFIIDFPNENIIRFGFKA